MQNKELFQFTFKVLPVNHVTQGTKDILYQAGCLTESMDLKCHKTVCLRFSKMDYTWEKAVMTTIGQIENAGMDLKIVEVEPSYYLVNIEQIAAHINRSRSTIYPLIKKNHCTFPSQIASVDKGAALWRWKEVVLWLYQHQYLHDEKQISMACIIEDFNIALQFRNTHEINYHRRYMLAEVLRQSVIKAPHLVSQMDYKKLKMTTPRKRPGAPLLLNQDQVAEIIKLYQEKKISISALCKQYHISSGTLYIYLKRKKIKMRNRSKKDPVSLTLDQVAQMLALYRENKMSVANICKIYNITKATLLSCYKRENRESCIQLTEPPLLLKKTQVKEMLKLYHEDQMSLTELCKTYRISRGIFDIYLRRAEINHSMT